MVEQTSPESAQSPSGDAPIAALDLGSNSFHLLIGRFVAGHFQILGKEKLRVQLAQGLSADGLLHDEAIERGLDALRQLRERLKEISPSSIRIVATYTLRKALNSKVFIEKAREILPCPIEIIPGHEEARLIYQGVAHTQPGHDRRLVFDIGGGSTEFIIGEGFEPQLLNSMDLGCVTFSERFFSDGRLTSKRLKKAELAASRLLAPIAESYRKLGWKHAYGCSGTIKAVAYCLDSGESISLKQLDELIDKLCQQDKSISACFPKLDPSRAAVLPGGLAVLRAACCELGISELQISDAALREGLVYDMEERMQHHDIRERTALSLAKRYHVDQAQAYRVQGAALQLFQAVKQAWQLSGQKLKPLLSWAALLHEVGISVNYRGFHRHGAYILANTDLPGFNTDEQQLLATLVSQHRKRIKQELLPRLELFPVPVILPLILLLRLAALIALHRSSEQPQPELAADSNSITITFPDDWLEAHPLLSSRLQTEAEDWAQLGYVLTVR